MTLSDRFRHFFHVVSNVRPLYWICAYLCMMPLFALIYWALPEAQFRIPDGAPTGYGSWLYYSIVTITTLGFGDYTPAHIWAQCFTAIEVMLGLSIFGFFLNSVGSMKSEIDVASEKAKQDAILRLRRKEMLLKAAPLIIHSLNVFMAYCYAVTTPKDKRKEAETKYNPDFTFPDMRDLYKPSGLPDDRSRLPAVIRLMKTLSQTSLGLDSLQTRIDLSQWPSLMEDCFKFVANYQMFASEENILQHPAALSDARQHEDTARAESEISAAIASWQGNLDFAKSDNRLQPYAELYFLIKDNATLARRIESKISSIADS